MVDIDKIPHILKYMGSKREILNTIDLAIKDMNVDSTCFCDLFSGTSVVSAAFLDQFDIYSNDIQEYSGIFANTYYSNLQSELGCNFSATVIQQVKKLVEEWKRLFPQFYFDYSGDCTYETLTSLEKRQQALINYNFKIGFCLFAKNYSGTYWSYEQCVWIDSIRAVAESYIGSAGYFAIMSALIFAMSYTTQSTGHFAQYRDVTHGNMNDILQYRRKDFSTIFERKLNELVTTLDTTHEHDMKVTHLDYVDCLRMIPENTIVYADPPYSNVHYSRFYHVIETLVKYDHPRLAYKGRYRDNRYQSPFDRRSQVENAFQQLFESVYHRKSHLILSYSDKGMITPARLKEIAEQVLGTHYDISFSTHDYRHSKMGRADVNRIDVNELLFSFKRKG